MSPRTSRRPPDRPGSRRNRRRREVASTVVAVVGAGAMLAFDVAADGLPLVSERDDVAATAADAGEETPTSGEAGSRGGLGGPLLSALPLVRRDSSVLAGQRAAERARARVAAAEAAEQQQAAERAAAERAAAQRAAVWDRLADCESGAWDREKRPVPGSARWSYGLAAGEDGFFQGGLQFHPVTWDEFRDPGMPDHAGAASRDQQVAIAERVLEVQGWKAWPVCSRKLGYR